MSQIQDVIESLLHELSVRLTPEGFKRSGQCLRKRLPNGRVRWSICLQSSRYATDTKSKFTFWIHAEWKRRPAYYDDWQPKTTWYGGAGDRVGLLMPQKNDVWWDINEGTTSAYLVTQIEAVMRSYVLPFLGQFETEDDIKKYLRSLTDGSMRKNYPHALNMLGFDILEQKNSAEIDACIGRVRRIGRMNLLKTSAIEEDIQRVLRQYGSMIEASGLSSSGESSKKVEQSGPAMPGQIPHATREDFNAMTQLLIPFAEKMLKNHGEFYPVAAMITTQGELVPFGDEEDSEMPDSNQVLDKIISSFQGEAEQGKIRAAGACYNGSVVEGERKLDAIILLLEHMTAGAFKGCVTYKKGFFGKYRLGELTMGRSEAKIFVNYGGL